MGENSFLKWAFIGFACWALFQIFGKRFVQNFREGLHGASASDPVCTRCLHQGLADKHTPGHILIEIILWLCFLVPGIIYTIWRLSSRKDKCAKCGSMELVPGDSPRAKQLLQSAQIKP